MRLPLSAVAVLSFLCVGHTAPTINCDRLTQKIPIENRGQLFGKWMYVAETVNIPEIKLLTKKYVDSTFVNISSHSDNNTVKFFHSQKSFGICLSFTSTSLMVDNSFEMTIPYKSVAILLTTGCPDCLVIRGNFTLGSTYYQSLQLLSRRRVLSTAELDEFKEQAECLKLPPPVFMDPKKDLCLEEQDTSSRDITSLLNSDMSTQVFGLLESVVNTQGGITDLVESWGNLLTAKED